MMKHNSETFINGLLIMKGYFSILLVLFFINIAYGQEAAVPFLTLQQSPLLQGAGQIGAAIPMKDASGFYYNPAQLGYFSRENNLSLFFMPQKTDWMPTYGTFQSTGLAAGYNFKKSEHDIPLSIGVGYLHNKFDYSSGSYESFDCFSIGASYDYFLLFNLGFSIKTFKSVLTDGPIVIGENSSFQVNSTAFDFGAMLTAPISKLLFNDYKFQIAEKSIIKPIVDFTLGYSLTNAGKKISYFDFAQSDPIPRTARLGYTFNFALELSNNWVKKLNVVDYTFTAEAENILVKQDTLGNTQYKNLFGDINIGKNLIELKGDQSVVVHRGHIFRLFDTFVIISGKMNGHGYDNRKSDGIGISSEGLFKILNASVDNTVINYLTNHFVLEYYNTNIFVDSFMETNLKGIVLNYRGIEF
jgi:hypothetical protein